MYATKSLDGIPIIHRNGRNVLALWEKNWDFAYELCRLLNEVEDEPDLLLTEYDRKWLKQMDHAFTANVQHPSSRTLWRDKLSRK